MPPQGRRLFKAGYRVPPESRSGARNLHVQLIPFYEICERVSLPLEEAELAEEKDFFQAGNESVWKLVQNLFGKFTHAEDRTGVSGWVRWVGNRPVCAESAWEFPTGGVVCSGAVDTASVRLEHEVVSVDSFD